MVVSIPPIEKNLNLIENLYSSTNIAEEHELYSKQAILELCGWIENEEDKIILAILKRFSHDHNQIMNIINNIILRNSSFDYKSLSRMLRYIIGDINLKRTEKRLKIYEKNKFIDLLKRLKEVRNDAAHNDLSNRQRTYSAPSITKNDYSWLKYYLPILKKKFLLLEFRR